MATSTAPTPPGRWRRTATSVTSPEAGLARTFVRALDDVAGLRLLEATGTRPADVAAGAPWPPAVSSMDRLLAAWMLLPVDWTLALGTLQALARRQGRPTDREPGRIPEGIRCGAQPGHPDEDVADGAGIAATPLFVMLTAEVRRWGAPWQDVVPLVGHTDRALAWITRHRDRDGDVASDWPLLARADVQGYVYGAYRARAVLARDAGDATGQQCWDDAAEGLAYQFNEAFWPHPTRTATGPDPDDPPPDAPPAVTGSCLWTGIIAPDHVAEVAGPLLSPQQPTTGAHVPTGVGGAGGPRENALIAAGLARYGYTTAATAVIQSQLDAAGRPGEPAPPAQCTSAAAWLLLRAMLRLDPDVPAGVVHLAPAVPARYLPLRVENVLIADHRVTIDVAPDGSGTGTHVTGLPPDLTLTQAV